MQTALVISLHLGSEPGNWVGRWSEVQASRRDTLDRAPALSACQVATTRRGYPSWIQAKWVPWSPSTWGPPVAAAAAAVAPMVPTCLQRALAAMLEASLCRTGVPPLSLDPWRRNLTPMRPHLAVVPSGTEWGLGLEAAERQSAAAALGQPSATSLLQASSVRPLWARRPSGWGSWLHLGSVAADSPLRWPSEVVAVAETPQYCPQGSGGDNHTLCRIPNSPPLPRPH